MRKNIFLFLIAVFALFISACGLDDEEEIVAGGSCYSEGSEICSDDGVELLLCQNSIWTLKKQCNISIGKRCRQNADGVLGCFSDTENDAEIDNDNDVDSDTSDHNIEEPDANDTSDTENETPDGDTTSEDPDENDDTDSEPQTDSEPGETDDNDEDKETPEEDSDTTPDNDTDSDTDNDNIQPDQCTSNSDCSGTTPYCSISTSECIANAVFITEYVEGESNNRAIEIYNGSKSPINLSNYILKQANAGSNAESRKDWGKDDSGNISTSFTYTFPLIQLDPDETYTVCNKESVSDLLEKCDDKPATGSTFSFTGNDGLALFEGNTILDQIGTNKTTPTEPWDVAGKEKATEDHTLRRKPEIIQGTTDWAASAGTTEENSEWIVLPKNTFNGLGSR